MCADSFDYNMDYCTLCFNKQDNVYWLLGKPLNFNCLFGALHDFSPGSFYLFQLKGGEGRLIVVRSISTSFQCVTLR